ncbi:MAG: translation initiation factor [Deltaproteobacteria bacterium]|nr:MAG: translation initiation factor [Deltaproteobacteria bacterium]
MSTNLGDLLRGLGLEGNATPETPAEPEAPATPEEPGFANKVVLRVSRKGRGGRTVTLIQGVTEGREALAKTLRKRLGLGVKAEGDELVVQGDQRDRLEPVLVELGVGRIVRG